MERTDISRLRKNRSTNLQIAFIITLSFVIWAFSYTEYYEYFEMPIGSILIEDEDIAIIRTPATMNRQLPPPLIQVSEDILIDVEEITEELEPQVIETNLDKAIEQSKDVPKMHFIVDKALPPPPPLPAEPVEEDLPFIIVEKMPLFGDCQEDKMSKEERKICSDRALLTYLYQKIRYPALARENNITGTAVIKFIIDQEGKVTDPKIVRNLAGGCGEEALRVIKNMPNWIPGQQRAKKVKVQMTLPVKFELR